MENPRKRKYADFEANEGTLTGRRILQQVKNQQGIRSILVLLYGVNDDPFCILQSAASHSKLMVYIRRMPVAAQNEIPLWELSIEKETVASGRYSGEAKARQELSRIAFEDLKKTCFSILRKSRVSTDNTVSRNFDAQASTSAAGEKVGGLGAKMLQKMGWTGGGLGAQEQGRTDLVETYEQVNRQGLGSENIVSKINDILHDFGAAQSLTSLAFSTEFSNEERAQIHKIARRYNLVSKSYGKGENRFLIVKCKLSRYDMVDKLIKEGGETEQYKLVYPENFK